MLKVKPLGTLDAHATNRKPPETINVSVKRISLQSKSLNTRKLFNALSILIQILFYHYTQKEKFEFYCTNRIEKLNVTMKIVLLHFFINSFIYI